MRAHEVTPQGLSQTHETPRKGRRRYLHKSNNATRGCTAAIWFMARFPLPRPWAPGEGSERLHPTGDRQYTVQRVPQADSAEAVGIAAGLNIITHGQEVWARREREAEEDFEDLDGHGLDVPRRGLQKN